MSQSWPNCQLIISFYGASAGATNFYQSSAFFSHPWRKIELIDLTNNLNSKRGPSSAVYHIRLSSIIIAESKRMRLAKNFNSNH